MIESFSRRRLLSLGAAGLASTLLSRVGLGADAPPALKVARSCIVLWMNGGPSHVDTFDPKPGTKVGGPFKAINTKISGTQISEHLPLLAEQMDKIALLRGVSSKEGSHERAQQLGHTGHIPNPTVDAPSLGAWVTKHGKKPALAIPSFVSLAGTSRGGGFFGTSYDPFVVQTPGALPDDLAPARPLADARAQSRKALLDAMEQDFERSVSDPKVAARRALYQKARDMMSASAMKAFDVSEEPAETVAAYGDSGFGRGCLVARRLVEVGVPFVEVTLDGWDTHANNFERTQKLMSTLDPAFSRLLVDLSQRGLLASTLVVCMGEFGRTPRISSDEGRDHHPSAFSVAMAGASLRGGTVLGQTDAEGNKVVSGGVGVPDVIATVASVMGVAPTTSETTPAGRPITVSEKGQIIRQLLV